MNTNNPTQPTAPASMATHTPWHVGMKPGPIIYGPQGEQIADLTGALSFNAGHNAQFIVRACNSHAQLVAALDTLEADAVNLHCALQSTAHMDPRDTRIAAITGQVVKDLLAMRDKARAALTAAQS